MKCENPIYFAKGANKSSHFTLFTFITGISKFSLFTYIYIFDLRLLGKPIEPSVVHSSMNAMDVTSKHLTLSEI